MHQKAISRYTDASAKMDASEFRKTQLYLSLSNSDIARILRISIKSVESYRSGARSVPSATAGFLRMIQRDHELMLQTANRGKKWRADKKYKWAGDRRREYNRAYQRLRRGDDSLMIEYQKKYEGK